MNAGAAFRRVKAEADSGIRVVGKFRTMVQIHGRIVLACGNHLESAGSEQRAETDTEGEVRRFFQLPAREMGSGVVTAVRRIDHNNEARSRTRRRDRCLGRDNH